MCLMKESNSSIQQNMFSKRKLFQSLSAVNATVGPGHPLHSHADTIVQKLPIQLRDKLNSRVPPDRPAAPSLKYLVNLHKKVSNYNKFLLC